MCVKLLLMKLFTNAGMLNLAGQMVSRLEKPVLYFFTFLCPSLPSFFNVILISHLGPSFR